MAEDEGTGITAAKVAQKSEKRTALSIRARVGRTARSIQTSFITDTDRVGIVVLAVGTNDRLGTARTDAAVALYVIMITYVAPMVAADMVAATTAKGIRSGAAGGTAMDDNQSYSSHDSWFLLRL